MSVMMTIDVEGKIVPDKLSVQGLNNCLKLFTKLDILGTFFVSGRFARDNVEVGDISLYEHEVASHGFYHRDLNKLDRDELEAEIALSCGILRVDPVGFRAPYCSFSEELLEVLEEYDFLYDSSIHPTYIPFRYDNRKYPIKPFKMCGILEIPISVDPIYRFPMSWIWMRNFGVKWSLCAARSLLRQGIDVVFYAHSWEFHDISLLKYISWPKRRRTGSGFIKMIEIFITSLLDEGCKFITMEEKAING